MTAFLTKLHDTIKRCILIAPVLTAGLLLLAASVVAGVTDPVLENIEGMIESGRFDEARSELMEYRRSQPDDPNGLFVLAKLEVDADRALALLKEVELLSLGHPASPDSALAADALYESGNILFMSGRIDEAVERFQTIVTDLRTSPRYFDAIYRLGVVNLSAGEPKKALEKFRTCLAGELSNEIRLLASTGKMECHIALNEWNDALASARDVLDREVNDSVVTPRVLTVLDRAWTELGNSENASYYRDQLLTNYPDSYEAHAIREKGDLIASAQADSTGAALSVNRYVPPAKQIQQEQTVSPVNDAPVNSGEAAGSRFSVQAGSFTDRMNAFKMYERLKMRGFDARVELKDVGGRHNYQVLVGRFATRAEANAVKIKVNGVIDGGSFIVGISNR